VNVLVTGARGYLGRALVIALEEAGHAPVAFVGDLLDPGSLLDAMPGVEAVCHLAGLTRPRESWERPLDYFHVNVTGTVNLLRAMTGGGAGLVFASTGAIYGSPAVQPMPEDLPDDPPHPYAASKRAAELAIEYHARATRMSATILRLFNVAGGADPDPTRIVPRVLAVAAGDVPHLTVNGDGSATRDLLHLHDAATAFTAAVDHPATPGEARRYNIGSGAGTSVLDVVTAARELTGQAIPLVHNPPAAEPQVLVADPTRAAAELGWTPRRSSIAEILADGWKVSRSLGA
jgi:nucleoside-diphosphate-sugar epimerase